MEKELKGLIENLVESIDKDNYCKNKDIARKILNIFKHSVYNYSDPDIFNVMFSFQFENIMRIVVEQLHGELAEGIKDKHKPNFIFFNYSFLKSNIEKLIDKKMNDSSCVADKSRYILGMYLNYSLTGVIPEDCSEEHYWIPKFGTNKNWMDFCDGLYHLYYGNNEKYLESYMVLLNAEIRRYKHIKCSLIATLKNGTKVVVNTVYDLTLSKNIFNEDSFVNIPKRNFQDKQEYQNADDLGELLNKMYYKVPKDDILTLEIQEELVWL